MLDLLVIGAGPTGMLMAAEAARHGLRCRIIDKGTSSYKDRSRAVGIQPRTLEIFDFLGIIDRFLAEGMRVRAANPMSGSRRLGRVTFDAVESPYPFILSIEQAKTERILQDYLTSFGIQIERGVECLNIEQTDAGVETITQNERIQSAWVVGCDGAHSSVRKAIDLPFEGRAIEDFFSLADVYMEWQYPHDEVFAFLNPKGILAAIPLPEPNRYRLVFQRQAKPTLEELRVLIREYAGPEASIREVVWAANFNINSRMTSSYRKERVFLAGDAAHIHSPVGAQGLNTGLQDACNLAWKLAYVQKKKMDASLLDTYDLERGQVGRRLLHATEKATYLATLRQPFAVWLRNFFISCLIKTRFQAYITQAISQTTICYPPSDIVKGKRAGRRAPNAPIGSSDLYTHWRKSTKFQLLLFPGPEKADLSSFAQRSDLIEPLVIHDPEAHRIYGVKKACSVLIRPDNYINSYTDLSSPGRSASS